MGLYTRPQTYRELQDCLKRNGQTILAGGSDFYPRYVGKSFNGDILDITGLPDLAGIGEYDDGWLIGATTCWSDIIAAPLPAYFDGLKLAAAEIGGKQIQNSGTIGGNICNASPAADGMPALLALDAEIQILEASGTKTLPLSQFVTGNRKTVLQEHEIVTGIKIRKRDASNTVGHFLKLGARKYLVISIVMVSAVVETEEDGLIKEASLAVGACSEVAHRLHDLERALIGQKMSDEIGNVVQENHLAGLSPIDDIRGSGDYRQQCAMILTRRLLSEMGRQHG
jgi:CO/xanthine dehydrogenase FAD-binding subunit